MVRFLAVLVLAGASAQAQVISSSDPSWTRLDPPWGGTTITRIQGIDNGTMVGWYRNYLGTSGFIYENGSWNSFNINGYSFRTYLQDVSGNLLAGFVTPSGANEMAFIYNRSNNNYSVMQAPNSNGTQFYGINGEIAVGTAFDTNMNRYRGVSYNITQDAWSFFDVPTSTYTSFHSFDNGRYLANSSIGIHLYDGSNWTPLSPAISGGSRYNAEDLSGSLVVGTFELGGQQKGFLFDGVTWTTIQPESGLWAGAYATDGAKIVGSYNSGGQASGFSVSVPEPSSLSLLLAGGAVLMAGRRREPNFKL